ncbi:hypothetical protein [Rhizosphaericola mali]|uniref:hypothetical protein n=1 Tax=Rhizosphaericola mali TaxID=2545455 RepID=UPI001782F404|nr:hypothetical protein [Rhizosphaericola mali]
MEEIGQGIDTIDNLRAGLDLPLPPQMHIEQLKIALTELSEKMKAGYQDVFGENPWD